MTFHRWPYLVCTLLAWLAMAGPAAADIVVLTSGRALTVRSHQADGDRVTLVMRDGGEITIDKALIGTIVPDEIPEADPLPGGTAAAAPAAGGVLPETEYDEVITSMAQAHGVNPVLVQALILVESGYRPRARSPKGAKGLMQLMPSTLRQYNVRNPYDPAANIAAGIKHLKALLDRLGTVDLALAAYNAGEGAVRKFKGIPPYRETRAYVARILSLAGLK